MHIIGLASLNHDPAVALMSGGRVVAAIESEKVTRAKHEISVFPDQALRAVLALGKLTFSDVDVIAVNYDARPLANGMYLPHLWRMLRRHSVDLGTIFSLMGVAAAHNPRVFARFSDDGRVPKIVHVAHHRAHLASTFLASHFEEAAVAVIDATGELECSSLWHCAGRGVRKVYSMDIPVDSLGLVYMLATRHLGFQMLGDEYKVMGLAPYGSPNSRYRRFFEELIRLVGEGRYRVDGRLLGRVVDSGWRFPLTTLERIGLARKPSDSLGDSHADFAYELQRRLEEAVLHMVRHLREVTQARHLCLAGGVALNCVANGRVLRDSGFEEVFVPPAPHDAGTALGAVLHHAYYELGGARPEPMRSPYLGPSFDEVEVERELRRIGADYVRVDDPSETAAREIAGGRVVGWFQGATEFGPRALGNRSILADPRRKDIRDRVNLIVKEREAFRPFAPAVMLERARDWFEVIERSPWMLFVDKVREERRSLVPAVVHVDGTARPQTVCEAENSAFYRLLVFFDRLTGVPMVLNTSLNVAGEPMVNTPAEALRCFFGSGLEMLFVGRFMLRKPRACEQRASNVLQHGRP